MSQQGKLDPVRTIDVKFRRDAQPGSMKRNSNFMLPGTDKKYAALGADGDKANHYAQQKIYVIIIME